VMNAVGVEFGEAAIAAVMVNGGTWRRKERGGVVRRKIIMATRSKVGEMGILVLVRGASAIGALKDELSGCQCPFLKTVWDPNEFSPNSLRA
jgi:hypothetical protein